MPTPPQATDVATNLDSVFVNVSDQQNNDATAGRLTRARAANELSRERVASKAAKAMQAAQVAKQWRSPSRAAYAAGEPTDGIGSPGGGGDSSTRVEGADEAFTTSAARRLEHAKRMNRINRSRSAAATSSAATLGNMPGELSDSDKEEEQEVEVKV